MTERCADTDDDHESDTGEASIDLAVCKKTVKTWVAHQIHGLKILERFLNPGVQCESWSSLACDCP